MERHISAGAKAMRSKEGKFERVMRDMRSRYWHALPARAYRMRRLILKDRAGRLEPGEFEELELLSKRLAEASVSYGFEEVGRIAVRITDLLSHRRSGVVDHVALLRSCDELDLFIDDMTIETLALRLRAALS